MIESRIYPSLDGPRIEWHEDSEGSGKGIVSIEVPKQRDDRKPFLIRRHIEENDKTGLLQVTPIEAVDLSSARNTPMNETIEAVGLKEVPIFTMACFPNYSRVRGRQASAALTAALPRYPLGGRLAR